MKVRYIYIYIDINEGKNSKRLQLKMEHPN